MLESHTFNNIFEYNSLPHPGGVDPIKATPRAFSFENFVSNKDRRFSISSSVTVPEIENTHVEGIFISIDQENGKKGERAEVFGG